MTRWRAWAHRAQIVALVALVAGIAAREWFPVRAVYFDPAELYVPTAPRGGPIVMVLDREIHRDFTGRFAVRVRGVSVAASRVESEVPGGGPYEPGAILPDPLTLAWLASPSCARRVSSQPGVYRVSVTWWVPVPVLGEVPVSVHSNLFEVLP